MPWGRSIALTLLVLAGSASALAVPARDGGTAPATSPDATAAVSFELDVLPTLAALGCSTGSCHGKARGQNGFQLSLLGFDPEFDYAAITQQARGRRIFPASPEHSLLLRKATATIPHGGGRRMEIGDEDYQTLLRWIASGVPRRQPDEPSLDSIEVTPDRRLMRPGETQQLRVTAHYSNATSRDVTSRSMFQSNESAVVSVDSEGLIEAGPIPGEAAIMTRFMGEFATCHVAIPRLEPVPADVYVQLPRFNFIDGLVWDKLQQLNIRPSEPVDDAKFLRRAYLDIIGRLPTPDEVRSFLADPDTDKRAHLIDRLLQRPEYADFWANKWVDLLRPNPYRVGIKAVLNYDNWIRDNFRGNRPFDHFVRDLVTARGSTWQNGATTMFRDRRSPDELTTMVSQLFLGIRLECAKCHHHPFERWGQDDFYQFAAYFARVGYKGTGLSPPISGGEEMVVTSASGTVTHPLTSEVMQPRPLFGTAPAVDAYEDPRQALAEWMTSSENEYFAKTIVNRVWADMMGRGLVEPVDDLRATNPASNEPLLDALAHNFRDHGYDLQHLIRTIASSHVYGLSSLPNDTNGGDIRNYSRHYRSRMRAEVVMDAVVDVTGVADAFSAMPDGSRATQIWTHRIDSVFLDTFGRPDANQDPPCERSPEGTVTQALHLMNAPALHGKITSDRGLAARLAGGDQSPAQVVEELYLCVYSRFPDQSEQQAAVEIITQASSRRTAVEDLLWALLNTPEFFIQD